MSANNPNITTIDQPGLDWAIHSLQSILAHKFDWMTVFHRAYPFREFRSEESKTHTIPKVWVGINEYMNVLPNDFLIGQAFFFVTDDEKQIEVDLQFGSTFRTEVSLIIWVNTDNVPGHTTGPSIAKLKKEINDLLVEHISVVKIESMTDQDAEQVFDGFTIQDVDTQYLMLPYSGLRINMVLQYSYSEC